MDNALAKRFTGFAMALVLALGTCIPTAAAHATGELIAASAITDASANEYAHEFVLSSEGIAVDGTLATGKTTGDTYEISKNLKLTITAGGTYRISGERTDAAKGIAVNTSEAVTFVLGDLVLSTTDEAPITCKSGSNVTVNVEGTVTLADNETDTSNNSDPDGAALKVAKGATATITGTGTLNANGNYKNGIKGGAGAVITIGANATDSVTVNAKAANNGIAADGSLTVNGGTLNVVAGNDGVKSSPDPDDTTSAGTITVNSGSIVIDATDEGIVAEPGSETVDGVTTTNATAESTITVNGGSLDITAGSDGIRAEGDITIANCTLAKVTAGHDGIQTNSNMNIANGTFDITTGTGAKNLSSNYKYDDDTSCKGLKANYGTDSSDDGNATKDTSAATNALNITGGTFALNTLDDAVHSDAYCTITGGTFDIYTGDDGMHADTSLTLGTQGGYERDPEVTIHRSYEGLESGSLFAYSGKFRVVAADDGINAAGGSDGNGGAEGPGQGFNPGGQPGQGMPGGQGGGRPGGNWFTAFSDDATDADATTYDGTASDGYGASSNVQDPQSALGSGLAAAAAGGYQVSVKGGTFYVDCNGDGLDSNGTLSLLGGQVTVFSQSNADNSAIDADGAVSINGATVFTAGATGMDGAAQASWFGSGQGYKTASGRYATGSVVNVTSGGSTVYSDTLPKAASYIMYSAPSTSGNALAIATGTLDKRVTNAWNHTWKATVTKAATDSTPGLITYTNSDTSATERKTIPAGTAWTALDNGANADEESSDSGNGSADVDARVDLSGATVSKIANKGYTGNAIKPKPTVKLGGTVLKAGTDYTLSYLNNVKRGTATVVITAKSDSTAYRGSTSATFNIVKGANTMTVATVAKSVSASKVASGKKALKALRIANARGSVTFTRVRGSKYLNVRANGKIVVAKGTPAGTYKVKVKVRASGNANFKVKSVTKTVKVTVR